MAGKKSTHKRSAGKKSASEKRIGTAAGSTIRRFDIAQAGPTLPAAANCTIQGDRLLNLANRRLYRQNKVYRMKVSLQNPNTSTLPPIKVFALQNTWWTRKSIALAKHIYDEAVSEERAVVGSSRWHDFRIRCQLPSSGEAFPIMADLATGSFKSIDEGTIADGEYQFSHVESTNATGDAISMNFSAVGQASTASTYDIFNEYNDMGPDTMNDPVFVAQGGYDRAMGTSFEAANVADLLNDGNLPPYNAGDLPFNSPWVQVGEIRSDLAGTSITSTGYFDAPLGLVYLEGYDRFIVDETVHPINLVDLISVEFEFGGYKGVEAVDIV